MSKPLPNVEELLKAITSLIADVESVNYGDIAIECSLLGADCHAVAEETEEHDVASAQSMYQASREIDEAAEELKHIDFDEIIGALTEAESLLTAIEETT